MFTQILDYIRQNRQYTSTKNELSKLSRRQLEDIGINPTDIDTVAYTSIYGRTHNA